MRIEDAARRRSFWAACSKRKGLCMARRAEQIRLCLCGSGARYEDLLPGSSTDRATSQRYQTSQAHQEHQYHRHQSRHFQPHPCRLGRRRESTVYMSFYGHGDHASIATGPDTLPTHIDFNTLRNTWAQHRLSRRILVGPLRCGLCCS